MGRSRLPRARRIAATGAAGLAFSALVACRAVLDLDAYEKAPCSDGPCDGGVDASPDVDAEAGVSPGSAPVSWAAWRMPNYDAGAAAALPNPLVYEKNGDEITDTVTSLVWHAQPVGALQGEVTDVTEAQAAAACAARGRYRLPKRIELVTLLDYGKTSSPLVHEVFSSFPSASVWTSSEVRPLPVDEARREYWTVDFLRGTVAPAGRNTPLRAVCVKAKASP